MEVRLLSRTELSEALALNFLGGDALTDGKIALRQLRKAPGFTLVALLILSFAIGASTATFSIVDSVLLRPYAFRDSGQLVVWRETIQEVSK